MDERGAQVKLSHHLLRQVYSSEGCVASCRDKVTVFDAAANVFQTLAGTSEVCRDLYYSSSLSSGRGDHGEENRNNEDGDDDREDDHEDWGHGHSGGADDDVQAEENLDDDGFVRSDDATGGRFPPTDYAT